MNFKQKLYISILALGLLSTAAPAQAQLASSDATQKIWEHHIAAWTSRNIPAILADYSSKAVVFVNGKRFEGAQEIGSLFAQLFVLFGRASRHIIDPAVVNAGLVYITWNARIDGLEHPVGTDTFVIQNEKIIYQTITSDDLIFNEIRN